MVFFLTFIFRLGLNIKRETHGLGGDIITLLHVWAVEDSTRNFLLLEAKVWI